MDIFYFLVTSSKNWTTTFHDNFFNAEGGFTLGVIGALIIGIVLACGFYFGCCNNSKTSKQANLTVWTIFLVISGVIGYFYADLFVIGQPKAVDGSVFKQYSFYQANQDYYLKQTSNANMNEGTKKDLNTQMIQIQDSLDKGGDVRFSYDITTLVLTILFFFITSMIVKRFTINGKSIPMLKP